MPVAELTHSILGKVMVNVRRNSHRISARWRQGRVCVNIPLGTPVEQLRKALDNFTPQLMACRHELSYYDGQRLNLHGLSILIYRQNHLPSKIICNPAVPAFSVGVGSDWDFNSPETTAAISNVLCKAACKVAAQVLVPRAHQLAARVGRAPIGWSISRGHRVLGRCSSKGYIALSYVLVFLPAHLADYVILHELAHLTEMNHSKRFHTLLNGYLGGREAELVAQLRSYNWPVLRR